MVAPEYILPEIPPALEYALMDIVPAILVRIVVYESNFPEYPIAPPALFPAAVIDVPLSFTVRVMGAVALQELTPLVCAPMMPPALLPDVLIEALSSIRQ